MNESDWLNLTMGKTKDKNNPTKPMPKGSNPKATANKAASKPNERSKGNETPNIQNNTVVEVHSAETELTPAINASK